MHTRYSTPEGGELSTATRCSTVAPEGGTRCSTTRPSTPRRGLRHLVALTQYVVHGTRTVAQNVVCPRRGAATLCHIDTRCSMLGYPQNIPRRGCDILSHTRCSKIIFYLTQDLVPPKGCDNLTH
jgi:hypothetical protein